jgi:hypothetical protein
VLWALAQPAAVGGLAVAFLCGLVLRGLGQRTTARLLGLPTSPRRQSDAFGALAAVLSGTGWGRPVAPPGDRRAALAVLTGPAVVLMTSQLGFAAYRAARPQDRLVLLLNRPSDVLHGVVAPTLAGQLMLSVAVGLLCFGLLALVPLPPLDGFRLARLAVGGTRPVGQLAERLSVVAVLLLLVVPVGARPPLLAALDVIGGPVVRAWA